MPINSTNWGTPTSPSQGSQKLYNTHTLYNTHIFYDGTYVPGNSPSTNFSNANPNSSNWAKPAVNSTSWSSS